MARPPRPHNERDRQREETRRRLYDATVSVVRRDGLDAARIEDIARLAGVSRATFYFHYPSKEDVLAELLQRAEQAVCAEIEALPPDAPLVEVLDTTARAIARQWQEDPALLRELGTVTVRLTARDLTGRRGPEARRGDPLAETDSRHPVHAALVPRFRAAHDRKELGDLIPHELVTSFFLVNLFGAAVTWAGRAAASDLPLDLVLRNVAAFFVRAASD